MFNQHCTKCKLSQKNKGYVNGVFINEYNKDKPTVMLMTDRPFFDKEINKTVFFRQNELFIFNKYIRQLLKKIINTHNIYLTSAIKCINYNKILKDNLSICRLNIIDELKTILPDYIILLGNITATVLFGKNQNTSVYGTSYELSINDLTKQNQEQTLFSNQKQINNFSFNKKIFIFCTYTLNSVVERLLKLPFLISSFNSFVNKILNINTEIKTTYKFLDTIEDVNSFFEDMEKNKFDILAVDTETFPLDLLQIPFGISFSYRPANAVFIPILAETIPVYNHKYKRKEILGKDYAIWSPDEYNIIYEMIKYILLSPKIKKILQNGSFDIKALNNIGLSINNFYYDTLIAARLINENLHSYSLKDLSFVYLNDMSKYDQELKKYLSKFAKKDQTYIRIPREMMESYAAKDADMTLRLYYKFKKEFDVSTYKDLFYNVMMPLREILTKTEIRGVKVNVEKVKQLKNKYANDLISIEQQIYESVNEKFNINSDQQLGKILFTKLGLPVIKFTKENVPSTDKESLLKLENKHPVINLLLKYKKLHKLKTTYLDSIENQLDKNNRIHTEYTVNGTDTGRLSSKHPNLQNIPRDSDLRNIFIAEDGFVFIDSDFDQNELRIAAHYSQDEKMVYAFTHNLDIHSSTAAEIYEINIKDVSKDHRKNAKAINFGLIYQMSEYGLSAKLNISLEEAKAFMESYFIKYNGMKLWIENTKQFILQNGYVRNVFGRTRRFPYINMPFADVSGMLRIGVNFPIQSTSGDITSIATVRNFKRVVQKYGEDNVRLVLNIHDELVYETKEDIAEQVQKELKDSMESPYFKSNIPFTTDSHIMKIWEKK